MGLDYEINLVIKHKPTNRNVVHIDVAYWRKNWGLAFIINEIAMRPCNHISNDEDFEFICYPCVLSDLIEELSSLLNDKTHEAWTNSLWGAAETRVFTIQNLARLCALQSWIDEPENDNLITLMAYADNYKFNKDIYEDFLLNPNDYEIMIEIINSY